MEYKLLESLNTDNENIDGAAFNNFSAGNRNGILKGILNECQVYSASSNTIGISTGELIIHGFRVKIVADYLQSFPAYAGTTIKYQIVAQLVLYKDRSVSLSILIRVPQALVQDGLYDTEFGTYEVEIATFEHTYFGVENIKLTLPIIEGDLSDKLDEFTERFTKTTDELRTLYVTVRDNTTKNYRDILSIKEDIASLKQKDEELSTNLDLSQQKLKEQEDTLSNLSPEVSQNSTSRISFGHLLKTIPAIANAACSIQTIFTEAYITGVFNHLYNYSATPGDLFIVTNDSDCLYLGYLLNIPVEHAWFMEDILWEDIVVESGKVYSYEGHYVYILPKKISPRVSLSEYESKIASLENRLSALGG